MEPHEASFISQHFDAIIVGITGVIAALLTWIGTKTTNKGNVQDGFRDDVLQQLKAETESRKQAESERDAWRERYFQAVGEINSLKADVAGLHLEVKQLKQDLQEPS